MALLSILSGVFGEKGLVGGVVDVLKSTGILKDPEAELKVTLALQDYDLKVRQAEAQSLETINATMREEAKSEHWMVWSWRPLFGYTCCATIFSNYILLPYLSKYGLLPILIPSEIWTMILVVLGVTAGTRGYEKIVKAGK